MWTEHFDHSNVHYEEEAADAAEGASAERATAETQDQDEVGHDITQRYFEDISRLPILTPAAEKDYARRMRQGDAEAREHLITHNLRLVVYVAKRYLGRGLPLLDLVEEGNLGLMHALEKFDPDRGFRLSTYALWWIRQSVERALMNHSRTIRLPVHVVRELNGCLRAKKKLEMSGASDVSAEAIAESTGKDVEVVREVLLLNRPPLPLDAPLDIDPDLTLGEAIADERCEANEERIFRGEMEAHIREWLAGLSERQRWVVERRFGLNNRDIATLNELSQELNVSRERVRKILLEAQQKLADALQEKGMGKGDVGLDA